MNDANEESTQALRHAVAILDAKTSSRHWNFVDESSAGSGNSVLSEGEEDSSGNGSSSSTSNDVLNSVHCFGGGLVVLEGFDACTGLRAVWTHGMTQWAADSLHRDNIDGGSGGISRRRCGGSSNGSSTRGAKSVWLDDGTFAWASNRNYELSSCGLMLVASNLATPPEPSFYHPSHDKHVNHASDSNDKESPSGLTLADSSESDRNLVEDANEDTAPSPAWLQDLEMETLLVPTSDGQTVPVSLVQRRKSSSKHSVQIGAAEDHGIGKDAMNSMDINGSVVLYAYGAVIIVKIFC